MKLTKRLTLLILVLLIVTKFFGCDFIKVSEDFYETYPVEKGTVLEVDNRNGSINLSGWDKDYVEVSAVKESWLGRSDLGNATINVEVTDKFLIETVHLTTNIQVSVHYDIKVPDGVVVNAVKSSNGSISLDGTAGNTEAITSNGNITIKNVEGIVTARSSNGNINIRGVEGMADIETSNGSIEAELPSLKNDLQIATSNGSITLNMAADLDAEINAKTSNGRITLHNLEIDIIHMEEKKLEGRTGDGRHRLTLTTSNGSIKMGRL